MPNSCDLDLSFSEICYSQQINELAEFSNMCFKARDSHSDDEIRYTVTNTDDFVILSSNEKFTNVQRFTEINELYWLDAGILSKTFRWSIDNETWSDWFELTLSNLNDNIRMAEYNNFYIEFKYSLTESGMFSISYISLKWEEHENRLKNWRPFSIAYAREKGNNKYPVRLAPFSYDPYKQNPAIKLQKDLSFVINNLYGHEITYFRAVPDKRSKDVIFKEYSLSNVSEIPKCLKVVVPNNEFPDNKFNYNQFGVDFEMPFEVHIDKRYFEWVFGNNIHPGKRDIIYFEFNDRIYEISSTQLVRDFMQKPIYYKLNLIKYQPKSSRIESQEIRESIDEYTNGFEKLFGKQVEKETLDITDPQQTLEKSMTYDPIRKWQHNLDFIAQYTIINKTNSIAEYYYDLGHIYDSEKQYTPALRYRVQPKFKKDDTLAYTAWIQEKQPKVLFKTVESISMSGTNDVTIKFSVMPNLKVGQWLSLTTSNNTDFEIVGQIQEIDKKLSQKSIKIKIPAYILQLAIAEYSGWLGDNSLIVKESFRRNFIYGYDEERQKGIKIDSFSSKYFRVSLNEKVYWFVAPKLTKDTWYGVVFNISKLYQQMSLHIYTLPDQTKESSKLDLYFEEYKTEIADVEFNLESYYEILASNLRITNIRLLSEKIEPEKHSLFLNMFLVKDSSNALIIDNAIPRLRSPYMGNVQ